MAATPHPIDALRMVQAALLEREDPASAMVANAIAAMVDDGLGFEEAMNLVPGWRSAARLRARDAALLGIAARRPGLSYRALAAEVETTCRRYEATAWPRDRDNDRRPDGLHGLLFDLLAAGGPPGNRHLRNIFKDLAGQSRALRLPG